MLPFYTHVVTRVRAGVVTDGYNNRALSWDPDDVAQATYRAVVEPAGSSETRGSRERNQVVTTYTVWFDRAADVANGDRLVWGDLTLDIDGEPLTFVAPWHGGHIQVNAVVSKG